jgi:hypothetical protein
MGGIFVYKRKAPKNTLALEKFNNFVKQPEYLTPNIFIHLYLHV